MFTRRQFLASLAALPVAGSPAASRAASPMVFTRDGLAINGFDPVAYFAKSGPRLGTPEQALMWKGAVWRFVSARNRVMFESNPWAYAPQFGGYCAYAMSLGEIAVTDPVAWRVYNGKLFLIHDLSTRAFWLRDISGNIKRANDNWPAVLRQ